MAGSPPASGHSSAGHGGDSTKRPCVRELVTRQTIMILEARIRCHSSHHMFN